MRWRRIFGAMVPSILICGVPALITTLVANQLHNLPDFVVVVIIAGVWFGCCALMFLMLPYPVVREERAKIIAMIAAKLSLIRPTKSSV